VSQDLLEYDSAMSDFDGTGSECSQSQAPSSGVFQAGPSNGQSRRTSYPHTPCTFDSKMTLSPVPSQQSFSDSVIGNDRESDGEVVQASSATHKGTGPTDDKPANWHPSTSDSQSGVETTTLFRVRPIFDVSEIFGSSSAARAEEGASSQTGHIHNPQRQSSGGASGCCTAIEGMASSRLSTASGVRTSIAGLFRSAKHKVSELLSGQQLRIPRLFRSGLGKNDSLCSQSDANKGEYDCKWMTFEFDKYYETVPAIPSSPANSGITKFQGASICKTSPARTDRRTGADDPEQRPCLPQLHFEPLFSHELDLRKDCWSGVRTKSDGTSDVINHLSGADHVAGVSGQSAYQETAKAMSKARSARKSTRYSQESASIPQAPKVTDKYDDLRGYSGEDTEQGRFPTGCWPCGSPDTCSADPEPTLELVCTAPVHHETSNGFGAIPDISTKQGIGRMASKSLDSNVPFWSKKKRYRGA
jgi:hypothetical protein